MRTDLKKVLLIAGASLMAASGASIAGERDQLAVSAGIAPSDAETMTLTELSAHKFNRDSVGQKVDFEPRQPSRPSEQLVTQAGLTPDEASAMSLTEVAAYFFNRGSSSQEQQTIHVTVGTREATTALSPGAARLAASAGLSEEEAQGLSLRQIAAHAFNRSESSQDRQRTDLP